MNDDEPLRLLERVSSHYFLENASAIADGFGGDLIKGLVFMAILRANAEPNKPGTRFEPLCTPTTAFAVAKVLGLAYETTRRHVNWLIDQGLCKRTVDGVIVAGGALTRPALLRISNRNLDNFRRFMGDIRQAGLDELA